MIIDPTDDLDASAKPGTSLADTSVMGNKAFDRLLGTVPHMLPTDHNMTKFCAKCGTDGGSCLTPGCPGYTGHAPSSSVCHALSSSVRHAPSLRVRHSSKENNYDVDENSDDLPLLSNCSRSLADVDHCRDAEPRMEVIEKERLDTDTVKARLGIIKVSLNSLFSRANIDSFYCRNQVRNL